MQCNQKSGRNADDFNDLTVLNSFPPVGGGGKRYVVVVIIKLINSMICSYISNFELRFRLIESNGALIQLKAWNAHIYINNILFD